MSRTTVAYCMALVLSLIGSRSLRQISAVAPGITLSPAVQEVVATYHEMMEELMAVMAGGGKPTERMHGIQEADGGGSEAGRAGIAGTRSPW